MSLQILILPLLRDNYAYLLRDQTGAVVIDPGVAPPVWNAVQTAGVRLNEVWITHHHADHCGGAEELKRLAGCAVIGPRDERVPVLDRGIGRGDTLRVGDTEFRVLAVPGHTRSHVAYYAPAAGVVFTGDCLFAGGCGRVLEGNAAEMWRSLGELRALPDATRVYCGHDYTVDNLEFAAELEPSNQAVRERLAAMRQREARGEPTVPSTIEAERQTNPFLRADHEGLARAVQRAGSPPQEVFAELRRRKDEW